MIESYSPSILQTPFFKEFVCPQISRNLCLLGLDMPNPKYQWRVQNDITMLRCNEFDTDDYYIAPQALIDSFTNPVYIPAYRISDMEDILPDYAIERKNTLYTVMIDSLYKVEPVSDYRLADALALMVHDCIRSRIININNVFRNYT